MKLLRRKSGETDPEDFDLEDVLGEEPLPTFPIIVTRAMSAMRQERLDLKEIGDLLAQDPTLTVRLLALVNSSAFALRHEVRSVHHAVSILGVRQIEPLLISCALGDIVPRDPFHEGIRLDCWKASARRAVVAARFADRIAPAIRSECFTAAMLQDVAIPVLLQRRRSYIKVLKRCWDERLPVQDHERETFGWDHAQVGARCVQFWRLPESLVRAINGHHAAYEEDPADELRLTRIVADLDAELDSGTTDALVERAKSELGVDGDATLRILEESSGDVDMIVQTLR